MGSYLTVVPRQGENTQNVSFMGRVPNTVIRKTYSGHISQRLKNPPPGSGPYTSINKIPLRFTQELERDAYNQGLSIYELLAQKFKYSAGKSGIIPVKSKTVRIDNVKVTSLIDGKQIFNSVLETIRGAEESIQIKGFEFQNLKVDGDVWPSRGAENVPGFAEQQLILDTLIKKRQSKPDMKIQVILDAHKWYIDGHGKKRHFGNMAMIKYLNERGIDVVIYPRDSIIQHEKVVIADGKKVVTGGMNYGTHSAANHDFCISIEKFKGKNSVVDNFVNDFNTDWKFSWYKIGKERFVSGPLNKAEQKNYQGINKEIKPENVLFYKTLQPYYDTPEARSRYSEERLDLIEANPVENPSIQLLRTKSKEYEEIGDKGSEAPLEFLMEKVKTAKKMVAPLFFFTHKELRKIVIQRFKAGELDAKFIIEKNVFPYCENAYDELMENGIPIRIYKTDKSTNQKMHGKAIIFDDEIICVNSANISARALEQNLGTGIRPNMPLNTDEIEEKIKAFVKEVKLHEDKLHLPNLEWDGTPYSYEKLKNRNAYLKQLYKSLMNDGVAKFNWNGYNYILDENKQSVIVDGIKHDFEKGDNRTVMAEIRKIREFYKTIQKRHLSKERYKRGNNENMLVVKSRDLAKAFTKQFDMDFAYSESEYAKIKMEAIPSIPPSFIVEG